MDCAILFPLYWICGEWKSNRKSPPVTVFRDGGVYKIALIYHSMRWWSAPSGKAAASSGQTCWERYR